MSGPRFKDHFSGHARAYRDARPSYPDSMYRWLRSQVPHVKRLRAWDCATGNGQVAQELVRYVDSVIATDASAQQVACARAHPKIDYRVASAELSGLPGGSVHWITVGQALHWFDVRAFYREAERVLAPEGLLSFWTYRQVHVTQAIDALIDELYDGLLCPYWAPERRLVEQGYATLLPDWSRLATPLFETACDWNVEQLAAYLSSWSATQRYQRETGRDPVAERFDALRAEYGAGRRRVRWALVLHAFRRPGSSALATL